MISRVRLVITGKVQGVCYRAFTLDQAVRLGLNGWVRNLKDGCVEAVFEGQRDFIEQAILACKRGPSNSHVTHIETAWEAPSDQQGFEIRY